ncbi:MAG: electron transfer flavoprotein subunit alpha [Nitrospina sp.]|nr:electron transfer flavoprotein subunit alpha [Nitrospina sp.]
MENKFTIVVVVEHDQNGIKPVTNEILNAASNLGGFVIAYYFSETQKEDGQTLIDNGADEVRFYLHSDFNHYVHETYSAALLSEIEKTEPDMVLLSSSNNGKELSAEMATRLGVALITDCIDLQISNEGKVIAKRPIFSGKAFSLCELKGPKPYFLTLRSNVFRGETVDTIRRGVINKQELVFPEFSKMVGSLIREVGLELDITEARIIVSGGLGMQDPANFKLLDELAGVLGAAVAASRPVVDNGWKEYTYQVGQTGRTVSPDLYIACGISGAVQHLAGMSSSRCIVAINSDPHAPIFSVADYGIVGDVLKIVPLLTQEFKNILGH